MKHFIQFKKLILFSFFYSGMPIFLYAYIPTGPDTPNPNVRLSFTAIKPKMLQTFDVSALNLKNIKPQYSVTQTNTAISIGYSDFNTISSIGNTWLLYQKANAGFSMNIGTANSTSPQTWVLPSNLIDEFSNAGRSDFIDPNSVPSGLEVAEANKIMRSYYLDNNDRALDEYQHYFIDNDGVDHLGTSYDVEVGDDDNFDEEPDYEFADVPLDLGDNSSTTIEEKDYVSNQTLTKYIVNSTVDAFGTISTPDGVYNCLRVIATSQRYTRPNEATAYTLEGTYIWVSFLTKEGVYFRGVASSSSGTANISYFEYRKIVPTAVLTELSDVKLGNDSKGVTINTDNDTAHPSAILDVKSENMGVLIPRIAKSNRPASPAEGLLIYQIDETSGFYYFDGTGWRIMGSSPSARISAESTTPNTYNIEKQSGFANLKKGAAFIKFNRKVENPEDLIINLQMEGDGKGLFVSKKTPEGFEVREVNKGKSNARFSYVFDIK